MTATDQAAGLRRLFGAASARMLPLLLPARADACQRYAPWLARLAAAFAQAGQRCVLVDATRAQIAAAMGLRARFDLAHVVSGECQATAARLQAEDALSVLPASRAAADALATSAPAQRFAHWLAPALAQGTEIVLLACTPLHAALLADGAVAVPVLADRNALGASLQALADVAGPGAASQYARLTFRLLFLGMEPAAAATLAARLGIVDDDGGPLQWGAAAPSAPALTQVVHASASWQLASIAMRAQRAAVERTL